MSDHFQFTRASRLRPVLYAFCFATLWQPLAASAQTDETQGHDLFETPQGLWVLPSKPAPDRPKNKLYGASSPAANWTISQWDIPEDLPPIENNATKNQYAAVSFAQPGEFTLWQNGNTLPCEKQFPSGKLLPDEFDLFIGPVTSAFKGHQTAFMGKREALSTLTQIRMRISVTPRTFQIADATCPITHAIMGGSVVLTNLISHQTFFYQLNFAIYQPSASGVALALPHPGWFFTGTNVQAGGAHQFGYGDRIWASFGVTPPPIGGTDNVDVNLLPRLKQLIADGARFGIDQNLADWSVTGAYYGQSVFGHIQFGTDWHKISLKAD
jgi:hypothetical protein